MINAWQVITDGYGMLNEKIFTKALSHDLRRFSEKVIIALIDKNGRDPVFTIVINTAADVERDTGHLIV